MASGGVFTPAKGGLADAADLNRSHSYLDAQWVDSHGDLVRCIACLPLASPHRRATQTSPLWALDAGPAPRCSVVWCNPAHSARLVFLCPGLYTLFSHFAVCP